MAGKMSARKITVIRLPMGDYAIRVNGEIIDGGVFRGWSSGQMVAKQLCVARKLSEVERDSATSIMIEMEKAEKRQTNKQSAAAVGY